MTRCLGLYSDANEAALARVVDFCRRSGSAALGIAVAYLVVIAAAMLILPPVNEVPADFSATTLWSFRLASLGVEAVLWTALGLIFGVLADRQLVPASSRSIIGG